MITCVRNLKDNCEEAEMLPKIKILTITRDSVLMSFLQQGLGNEDYEVINTQHTGYQLKDIIETEQPAFIVLDIIMPTLDGIGTCLKLRQWTQLPIMMLSTWGTGNGTIRGLDLCSDSYLTEPFGPDVLKTRIEDTLKRSMAACDPLSNLPTRGPLF
jgi:DNA-binding response OmpR family regulator